MYVRITRSRLIILGIALAAAGAWLLVDWIVVTDKERVEQTLGDLARAVETNDPAALAPFLDPSFRLGGMDAETFQPWYEGVLAHLKVKRVSVYDSKVVLDDKNPDAATASVITYVILDRPAGEYRVDWQLAFHRRTPTEWKLARVRAWQPMTGAEIPLGAVNDWLR